MSRPKAVVVGAGPAGLMAAEVLARGGLEVVVHERMPSPARRLLMAGRGGLNLTHSEPVASMTERYGAQADRIGPLLQAFSPRDLRDWAEGLGQDTFVGSSGRVFPVSLKASPLVRAWLLRLEGLGVRLRLRSTWTGWTDDGSPRFRGAEGRVESESADALVLALGGASWPRLGADGAWTDILGPEGIPVAPLQPSNCGFVAELSPGFTGRFGGTPLKAVALRLGGLMVRGEIMITARGVEGGAIYALSGPLRESIAKTGEARLLIDLRPDRSVEDLADRLLRQDRKTSLSNRLRKALGLPPAAIALLREAGSIPPNASGIARRVKAVPLRLTATGGLQRAISTAGGVRFEGLDPGLQLKGRPGVWITGEMLDWEAPTGGYLLQAAFATGVHAARDILRRLGSRP